MSLRSVSINHSSHLNDYYFITIIYSFILRYQPTLTSSTGFFTLFSPDLFVLKAMSSEIGPTLPKYMVRMITIIPGRLRDDVRFLVRPTVAVALTVSYKISIREKSVKAARSTVDVNIIKNDVHTTATALPTA